MHMIALVDHELISSPDQVIQQRPGRELVARGDAMEQLNVCATIVPS